MIREVEVGELTRQIRDMCIQVNHYLSKDMACAMETAAEKEQSLLGKKILGQLEEKEGVLVQEVPLEKLELYRGQIPILQGRRTDLYGTREA